jgi:hypothetical protein
MIAMTTLGAQSVFGSEEHNKADSLQIQYRG